MRPATLCLLMLLVSACAGLGRAPEPVRPEPRPSGEALCAGLEALARTHAAALAERGDDVLVGTGDLLIEGLRAGCAKEQAA